MANAALSNPTCFRFQMRRVFDVEYARNADNSLCVQRTLEFVVTRFSVQRKRHVAPERGTFKFR
jgi:hypothetical protein